MEYEYPNIRPFVFSDPAEFYLSQIDLVMDHRAGFVGEAARHLLLNGFRLGWLERGSLRVVSKLFFWLVIRMSKVVGFEGSGVAICSLQPLVSPLLKQICRVCCETGCQIVAL